MEKISSSIEKGEDPEKIEETVVESITTTTTTTTTIRRPWEDLPHHLLQLFLKPISEPIDRPNLRRVCMAWRDFKPPPCFPALVYGPTMCSNIIVKGGGVDYDEPYVYRICFGSSQGWLIIRIVIVYPEEYRFYLLNIYTKDTILLPILRECTLAPQICLSSQPTDPDCIAVLFDVTFQEGFMFSKRGWNKWIKSDCKYPICSEPGGYDYIYYVFLFQTKLYACTIRGKIVAIDINVSSALLDFNSRASAPPITSLAVLPVDSILPSSTDWFQVESLGKLLAVRLYRRGKKQEIINLDVLELDFKTMSWIKVKNLPGDQVLFISLFSSFSISGSEIGIGGSGEGGGQGGNCIYVSDHALGKIHKYDMHNQEMMVCTGYGYPPKVDKYVRYISAAYARVWVKPTFV